MLLRFSVESARRGVEEIRRDVWLQLSWLGLLVIAALIAVHGMDAGITYDEQLQAGYGDRILDWYRSGMRDDAAMHYKNLYLYGGLFEAPVQWLARRSPFGLYETRHLLTASVAAIGVIGAWKIAALFGGAQAGFFAAGLLFLTPAWTGHGLFNSKDVPFGAAVAFSIHGCLRILISREGVSSGNLARAGLAIGVALGIRVGGAFLLVYLWLAVIVRLVRERSESAETLATTSARPSIRRSAVRTLGACILAWLVMLSAWPWAQLSPLVRPFVALRAASHFKFGGMVLFDGQLISAKALPAAYLPVWFAITLPETYLFAALAGAYVLASTARRTSYDRRKLAGGAVLCLTIIVPFLVVIITRPVLYDAHRHALFVLPLMASVAGVAISAFLESPADPRSFKLLAMVVYVALAAATAADMVQLHPYEYVYFNRIYGGLPAASGRFETDYWGASYLEGFEWIATHAPRRASRRIRIGWCTDWIPLNYYIDGRPTLEPYFRAANLGKTDYFLTLTRYSCQKKSPPGHVVHSVSRMGVPLLFVYERDQP
jgi:hypothetical protein